MGDVAGGAEILLVVNADDFGLCAAVNRGVVECHRRGVVTSASLMVNRGAAAEAAELARGCPRLGVGLHLDFGDWVRDAQTGEWLRTGSCVALDDEAAVGREVADQIAAFERLMGRGPTHLDSHQHVHLNEPALRRVAERIARELRVPLRGVAPGVRYCGEFYGQDGRGRGHPDLITPAALCGLIGRLAAGVTEIACHPAARVEGVPGPYRDERVTEAATLVSAEVRECVLRAGVRLVRFDELRDSWG